MRRENRIKISFKYFESFETIYRVCVTWVARWCDVVFHTCLPFCINGLAWAILWLPLGAAFRLLSGCQRTKCNRNVLDYRTNLLCCSGISSSSPPRSFHSKCKTLTPHVGFTFFFGSLSVAETVWRLFARRTRVNKGFMFLRQRLYYGQRWDTVMAQTHLSTVVFFIYIVALATDLCVTRQRNRSKQ